MHAWVICYISSHCHLALNHEFCTVVLSSKVAYDSAFHLSYNMLLNQMRSEESNPEELLRQSFHQFQCDRALPKLQVIFFPFFPVLLIFS